MNRTELAELIHHRENSRVEFERDDATPQTLARGMAALLTRLPQLSGDFDDFSR